MTKYASIEEIREFAERSRLKLFGESARPNKRNAEDETTESENTILKQQDLNATANSFKTGLDDCTIPGGETELSKPLQNALRIIRAQAGRFPFLFRQEAARLSGIKGGASIIQAEKAALKSGYIIKHFLPFAKTNKCFWEITELGYKRVNLEPGVWHSKGGYSHKFCVYRIARQEKNKGLRVKIESYRPNGKAVDLEVRDGDELRYYEICSSWPIEKECTNIEKDLEGDPLPIEIICAVTERKMKTALEEKIRDMNSKRKLKRPVRVVLAGDIISPIDEV